MLRYLFSLHRPLVKHGARFLGWACDPKFTVVWHLRCTDIAPHARDLSFYTTMKSELEEAVRIAQVDIREHFSCAQENKPDCYEWMPFNTRVVATGNVTADFFDLVDADVLISSGSSFPRAAALFARPSLVFLSSYRPGTFKLQGGQLYVSSVVPGEIPIDATGHVLSQEQLVARLRERVADKQATCNGRVTP